ncbi:MAG: hypothetical protein EOP09_19915 [Proteobacteria bacterium]|nr:MAG: hypothetical protein EOP09_19915 [Pseudomonadota bacterium]
MKKLAHSLLEGLHRLTRSERLERVQKFCGLTDDERKTLSGENPFPVEMAEHFIENVVGIFPIPLGVATHFHIDGREVLIPMAVE